MSNQLNEASSSSSEYESDSEEEGMKSQQNLLKEPPKQQPQQEVSEAKVESDSDSEEVDTKSKLIDLARDSEPETQHKTVKEDANRKVATKAGDANGIPGKRGRDVIGLEGASTKERLSKKSRDAEVVNDRSQLEELPSPGKTGKRAATRATRATAASKGKKKKAEPSGKVENAKPEVADKKKRKASTPATTPQQTVVAKKTKKPVTWTTDLEGALLHQLYTDYKNDIELPNTKNDSYWDGLLQRLPLDDLSGRQLYEKVRRMKQRYRTLQSRTKRKGGRLFKSPHEGKIFQLWDEMWNVADEDEEEETVADQDKEEETSSQQAADEDSDDESAGAVTPPGQVTNGAAAQAMGESSSSEDEDEEDPEEMVRRNAAGLNLGSAASTPVKERVSSPFVSKSLLKSTPFVPKEDKEKGFAKVEEVIRGDGKKGDVIFLADEHLKQLRNETLAFFQELRGTCFQAMEERRNWGLIGGLGDFASVGKGFMFPGMQEGFANWSGSQAALELQKKWKEHKIHELTVFSERLRLMQEQCRLRQEELKLQDQRLEQ